MPQKGSHVDLPEVMLMPFKEWRMHRLIAWFLCDCLTHRHRGE